MAHRRACGSARGTDATPPGVRRARCAHRLCRSHVCACGCATCTACAPEPAPDQRRTQRKNTRIGRCSRSLCIGTAVLSLSRPNCDAGNDTTVGGPASAEYDRRLLLPVRTQHRGPARAALAPVDPRACTGSLASAKPRGNARSSMAGGVVGGGGEGVAATPRRRCTGPERGCGLHGHLPRTGRGQWCGTQLSRSVREVAAAARLSGAVCGCAAFAVTCCQPAVASPNIGSGR